MTNDQALIASTIPMFAYTRWFSRTPGKTPARQEEGLMTPPPIVDPARSRLLVLSASVGAGHIRAAQALELALREVAPNAEVRCVDVLELTNAAFRRLYGRAYLDLVNRAPHVLGYFYDLLDRPVAAGTFRGDNMRLMVEKMNLRRFIRLLQAQPWDLIVSTHFLPAEIVASLRQQNKMSVPHATVTTDYETHRLWVNQPCDLYFTATDEGARYLRYWGVPAEHLHVCGIPIHPVFSQPKDQAACRAKHGLTGGRPVVLQLAGGFGVGPVEQLLRALTAIEQPVEIAVVAGRNEKVRKKLEGIAVPPRHRVKIWGYTEHIDELMCAADLVVSKPGGLTTSETLARGRVMAIVNPTPGQEYRNSDYLLENGAAIKINNIGTLSYKVGELLSNPQRLACMQSNIQRLARPRAAFDVAARALQLLPEERRGK
jgi:processive 1,2-diacylglycerol beta-glucosyltransferase